MMPIFAAFQWLFQILLAVTAIFLILLVLVQRGRGGGLAGALGGMGGSSAFGAKAGDIFTRITVFAAAFWIILCIAATKYATQGGGSRLNLGTPAESTGPLLPGAPDTGESTGGESASETLPADSSAADESSAAAPADASSEPAETK